MSRNIKISIVGATGYTGVELLRLLANHPKVEVVHITSRQEKGRVVSDVLPSLRGYYDVEFSDPDDDELSQCDLVFFATPPTVAMKQAAKLLNKGTKVIDLSADFRLKDTVVWEQWYHAPHAAKEYIDKAVYGLVELNRHAIKTAQLIAVPGCYVTAVTLALLPILAQGLPDKHYPIIADCKSGKSGGGKVAIAANLFCEVSENIQAYALNGHRHLPEIQQNIALFDQDTAKQLIFVPHVVPMIRGLQATIYVRLQDNTVNAQKLFRDYYSSESFVDVVPTGTELDTRNVRGTNKCQLAIHQAYNSDYYIIVSILDNLIKGASGQAIHNMNIMFGFEETLGLQLMPLAP